MSSTCQVHEFNYIFSYPSSVARKAKLTISLAFDLPESMFAQTFGLLLLFILRIVPLEALYNIYMVYTARRCQGPIDY